VSGLKAQLRGTGSPRRAIWQIFLVSQTNRLSHPQKIVVVTALGVAFLAAGSYLTSLGSAETFGWYAYAPLTSASYPSAGLPGWARLVIWLALTAAWALAAIWILRPARQAPPAS
jgi:hypothetical protein